jgi:pilus assembly protein Flp/PilA
MCFLLVIQLVGEKVLSGKSSGGDRTRAHMLRTFKRLLAEESGATAIEYGLICAAIGLAILAALNPTGAQLIAALTFLLNAFP